MRMPVAFLSGVLLASAANAQAPSAVLLWPSGAPGSAGKTQIFAPQQSHYQGKWQHS